ncbi:hypothetical protein M427DRAFT_114191 [Gonapodya prolifera JEL478]|uniref:VIT-domain-containing protein n=1 Tax=Gonapodya prolifera (strain JEL478) TaxID=1344416 RepID=A0A139A6A9_GONPJ|nr:hypothetical protein M427DRAFT_114191 [Gonapodya prolifera JEL478]|eukprot:KXS12336.1 hypothetical protein M427DRAFT_114191 [Gonapodya prolifera JEL478]
MAEPGLFIHDSETTTTRIPLQKVHAAVAIVDCLASVTLSQTYFNDSQKNVEAVYKFPVYESAAVYRFEAEMDGIVILGVCKEREKAAEEYNKAIQSGDRAFLLEEQKADIFQISVGNIPSRKPVLIRISYVHELQTDEDKDEVRFTLPTTIASKTYGTFDPPKGTNLLPGGTTYSSEANYNLSVSIGVKMAIARVAEVSSPTHPIKVSLDSTNQKHATASLALDTVYLDMDFVLVVKAPGLAKPRAVLEKDPATGSKCCMVTFVPKFSVKEVKTEVVFILDRSGSMSGSNIKSARSALLLLLKSLPPTCHFNIIGFGSHHVLLFPKPVPYNEENLRMAIQHAESVDADLGGTEMMGPLQDAVREPLDDGWQRSIITLTDGEIYEPTSIFLLASRTSRTSATRFFTLGVGASVSHLLVNGLARAGMGTAEFVGSGERMEGKVMKLMKAGVKGFLRSFKVKWLGDGGENGLGTQIPQCELPRSPKRTKNSLFDEDITEEESAQISPVKRPLVQPAPFNAPPLYAGTRYIAFAILDRSLHDPTSVVITAEGPDGLLELEVPIGDNTFGGSDNLVVHRMAAKKLVQDLEEGTSYLHNADGVKDIGSDELEKLVREETVAVSATYGVASKYISYVAVQVLDDGAKAEGQPERLIIPSMDMSAQFEEVTCEEYEEMDDMGFGLGFSEDDDEDGEHGAAMIDDVKPRSATLSYDEDDEMGFGLSFDDALGVSPVDAVVETSASTAIAQQLAHEFASRYLPSSASPPTNESILAILVSLQRFDGSFSHDIRLTALLNEVPQSGEHPVPPNRTSEEWYTALAISLMEVRLLEFKDEWEMLAAKSVAWLEGRMEAKEVEELLAAAKMVVQAGRQS